MVDDKKSFGDKHLFLKVVTSVLIWKIDWVTNCIWIVVCAIMNIIMCIAITYNVLVSI